MAFLELKDLCKSFGGRKVLDRVSLSVEKGAFVSLLGLSGCGKTTLLRIIAGVEQPDSGSVWLDGKDMTKTLVQQRQIGFVHQNFALFPHMTVLGNTAYGLKLKKDKDWKTKSEAVLAKVNLLDKAGQFVSLLSGGEQQRVALARTIVTQPVLMLLDEPLSNLDQSLRVSARNELKRLQRELGITTVFVTHDQSEALALSDVVAVMDQGRILQSGSPESIYFGPKQRFTAAFVGRYNLLEPSDAARLFDKNIASDQLLAFLPEKLKITHDHPSAAISQTLFGGIYTELLLKSAAVELKAVVPTQPEQLFRLGDKVGLSVADADFLILKKD